MIDPLYCRLAIVSDTINVIDVKLRAMVLLIELYLFISLQWPWPYFRVTAMWNNFNWKIYVLIQWNWNFVWFLSKSCRQLLYHYFYFLLLRIFKGGSWHNLTKTVMLACWQTLFKGGLSNFAWFWPCSASSNSYCDLGHSNVTIINCKFFWDYCPL